MIEAIASVKQSHSAFRHGTDPVPSSTSKWQIKVNQGPRDARNYRSWLYLSISLSIVPGASSNPCNDAYRGTHAFSEVEVRNVANYLKRKSGQIAGYMDVHAYSQLWMIPWGYTRTPTSDHEELVGLCTFLSLSLYMFVQFSEIVSI